MAMHILDSLVTLPPRDINGDNLIISQLSLHVTLALLNSGRGGGGLHTAMILPVLVGDIRPLRREDAEEDLWSFSLDVLFDNTGGRGSSIGGNVTLTSLPHYLEDIMGSRKPLSTPKGFGMASLACSTPHSRATHRLC